MYIFVLSTYSEVRNQVGSFCFIFAYLGSGVLHVTRSSKVKTMGVESGGDGGTRPPQSK